MGGDEDERPAKRVKVGHSKSAHKGTETRKNRNAGKYRAQAARDGGKAAFRSPGLQSGDVGIFVTSDKGQEKRCLREAEDLLVELMDLGQDDGNRDVQGDDATDTGAENAEKQAHGIAKVDKDIEVDILSELKQMQGEGTADGETSMKKRRKGEINAVHGSSSSSKLSLITLDIPCVSFVRFPPMSPHDPADVCLKVCRNAAANPDKPRSRYIKRLTPLTKVRKVMSDGIKTLCDEVLTPVFGREQGRSWRDEVIKIVAERVQELADGDVKDENGAIRHPVDLKGYEKLILVEVYRNVVGMSVVGSEWEKLKKFNLAEIFAAGRKEKEKQ